MLNVGAHFSSKLYYAVCMISIKLNQCVPGYIPPFVPHKINHVPIRTSWNSKCRWLLRLPLVTIWTDRWGMQSQLNDVKRYFGADIQRMLQEFEALGLCCSWLMLFDLFDWWGSHALNHFYKLIWIIYADICRPVRFVCVFSVGGFGLEVPSPWPRSWCSAPFPRLSARHESDCYAG